MNYLIYIVDYFKSLVLWIHSQPQQVYVYQYWWHAYWWHAAYLTKNQIPTVSLSVAEAAASTSDLNYRCPKYPPGFDAYIKRLRHDVITWPIEEDHTELKRCLPYWFVTQHGCSLWARAVTSVCANRLYSVAFIVSFRCIFILPIDVMSIYFWPRSRH